MLRPCGTFYLWDFSFDPADADAQLQRWIDTSARDGGFTRSDYGTRVREEFST